jgi:hypothetical protein
MHIKKYDQWRFLRFAGWALAMLAASVIAEIYAPRIRLLVPCFFLLFFVPVVLLPFESKRKE